jgi:hypothetical protein
MSILRVNMFGPILVRIGLELYCRILGIARKVAQIVVTRAHCRETIAQNLITSCLELLIYMLGKIGGKNHVCTCGSAPMTVKHPLQTCPTYSNERMDTWQQPVTIQEKLYRDAWNLELTAAFFKLINVSV